MFQPPAYRPIHFHMILHISLGNILPWGSIYDLANVTFDVATALEIVTFQSEDHQEALAAIREKRKPVFKGR